MTVYGQWESNRSQPINKGPDGTNSVKRESGMLNAMGVICLRYERDENLKSEIVSIISVERDSSAFLRPRD